MGDAFFSYELSKKSDHTFLDWALLLERFNGALAVDLGGKRWCQCERGTFFVACCTEEIFAL